MNGTNLCKRKSIPWCSSDFNESYLCLYSFPCTLFILNIPHLAKRHEQFANEPRMHLGERVPQNTLADLWQRSNTDQLSVIVAKDVRSKDCSNTWHLNRKSVRREVWLAVPTASRPPFLSFVRQSSYSYTSSLSPCRCGYVLQRYLVAWSNSKSAMGLWPI